MFEGITCVYRSNVDLYFYVFGSSNENEVRFVSTGVAAASIIRAHHSSAYSTAHSLPLRHHCRCFLSAQLILASVLTALYDAVSIVLR